MTTITQSEVALLMLLSEGPKHPYQIEKDIEESSMDYWTELSQSSIYKCLRQLEAKGFATSRVALNERNVGRKTYTITDAGLAALKSKLVEFIGMPEKTIWRVDLATSHLDLLSPKELEVAFDSYGRELEKLVAGYRALETFLTERGCPAHSMALARRPIRLYEAELAWLAEYRASMRVVCNAQPREGGKV